MSVLDRAIVKAFQRYRAESALTSAREPDSIHQQNHESNCPPANPLLTTAPSATPSDSLLPHSMKSVVVSNSTYVQENAVDSEQIEYNETALRPVTNQHIELTNSSVSLTNGMKTNSAIPSITPNTLSDHSPEHTFSETSGKDCEVRHSDSAPVNQDDCTEPATNAQLLKRMETEPEKSVLSAADTIAPISDPQSDKNAPFDSIGQRTVSKRDPRHPVTLESMGERSRSTLAAHNFSHNAPIASPGENYRPGTIHQQGYTTHSQTANVISPSHEQSIPSSASDSGLPYPQSWPNIVPRASPQDWRWPEICNRLDELTGEGFRQLAKQLQWTAQQGKRLIAFVSPANQCGRSTVLLTLARILSRDPNAEALIIDFDRTHPSLGSALKCEPVWDIEDVLTGKITLGNAVIPSKSSKLFLLPMKREISDTDWMSLRSNVSSLLTRAKREYDLVLIDGGVIPVGTRLEDCWLRNCVDAVITVSRSESSPGSRNPVLDWKQIGIESLGFIETFA